MIKEEGSRQSRQKKKRENCVTKKTGPNFASSKRVDGWMTCDLTSFLTVFHSYQDDEKLINERLCAWNLVYG